MTAGIAAKRPIAVAIKASDMPGATTAKDAWFTVAKPLKEFIIPHTVPNSPIYGLVEPTVARKDK